MRLKMPGIQEAMVFSETHTEREVWGCVPEIDDRIELRWVMPGKSDAYEFVYFCFTLGLFRLFMENAL